jgi:hypothetical protein
MSLSRPSCKGTLLWQMLVTIRRRCPWRVTKRCCSLWTTQVCLNSTKLMIAPTSITTRRCLYRLGGSLIKQLRPQLWNKNILKNPSKNKACQWRSLSQRWWSRTSAWLHQLKRPSYQNLPKEFKRRKKRPMTTLKAPSCVTTLVKMRP